MNVRSLIKKAVSVATAGAAMLPAAVLAQGSGAISKFKEGVTATGDAVQLGPSRTLPELIGRLVQQAMGLLGIILVVLVIYAGFLWMTAQGAEDKIKKAKQIISSAVIGLVLIFAAYSITGFVVSALEQASV